MPSGEWTPSTLRSYGPLATERCHRALKASEAKEEILEGCGGKRVSKVAKSPEFPGRFEFLEQPTTGSSQKPSQVLTPTQNRAINAN